MDNQTQELSVFRMFPRNSSYVLPGIYDMNTEDTIWVLSSTFIIFTMQTGFAMVESGCVTIKNEANIMMKNIIDMVLGGFTYWLFGYAIAFGRGAFTTPFFGLGDFFLNAKVGDPLMGPIFAAFLFQLSFATTATTIVSGSLAERCNFRAYCIFSFLNMIVYSVPSGWVWGEHGFLHNLGAIDIAGTGPVHLVGGASALAAAFILGPRLGRYDKGNRPPAMCNPEKACVGLFILWWGWLAFNAGSTYGVSGEKWHYAARAAVLTMLSSFGGGMMSLIYSMFRNGGKLEFLYMINGIISSLVSITAGCFLYNTWEAVFVGMIGALLTCLAMPLFDKMKIDDPLGSCATHCVGGIWGMIAVGLFSDNPIPLTTTSGRSGLLKGGGLYLLGIQSLTAVVLLIWGITSTFLLLWTINKFISIRMDPNDEFLGADLAEHNIRHFEIDFARALQALAPGYNLDTQNVTSIPKIAREMELEGFRLAEQHFDKWGIPPKENTDNEQNSIRRSIRATK